MDINKIHTAYFLGIGGIGMSALARYLASKGVQVSGYDKTATPLTRALEAEGIKIHYTADISQFPANTDVVVFTPAVPDSFEEWPQIKASGVPVVKRAAMLAEIINSLQLIAVAGTHGKTTVSAMLSHAMENMKVPFLGFVGGVLSRYNKNIFMHPDAQWAIAEADEYDRSFLQLKPFISIINAIDADHLDIYGSEEMLHQSFSQFAAQTSKDGYVLVFDNIAKEKLQLPDHVVLYGFTNKKGYSARNIHVSNGRFVFDIFQDDTLLEKNIQSPAAGRHNIQNATAAFAALHLGGFSSTQIAQTIESYPGVKRRLELIAENSKVIYYDDYAHHPAEIAALINTIRELYPERKITGIFQPHLFTRTRDFGDEFGKVLSLLDVPVITDIYPARELPLPGIDAQWLLSKVQNPAKKYLPYRQIPEIVTENLEGILLTIGAGDIDAQIESVKKRILTT
jgi:UDP-N-acetylmuramate--alanine ligase